MTVPSRYILPAENNPADVLLVREALEDKILNEIIDVIAGGERLALRASESNANDIPGWASKAHTVVKTS